MYIYIFTCHHNLLPVCVTCRELPDNPDVEWNIGVIATELCPVVEEIRPEQVSVVNSMRLNSSYPVFCQ